MRLPLAERAIIAQAKIRDYLLSTAHWVERFKADLPNACGYRRKQHINEVLCAHIAMGSLFSELFAYPPDPPTRSSGTNSEPSGATVTATVPA